MKTWQGHVCTGGEVRALLTRPKLTLDYLEAGLKFVGCPVLVGLKDRVSRPSGIKCQL